MGQARVQQESAGSGGATVSGAAFGCGIAAGWRKANLTKATLTHSALTGASAMRLMLILPVLALGACSPEDVADKVGRRTVETVVSPVVGSGAATRCVVENADAAEVQALMRDVGVVAGTSTEARIAAIIARAPTQDCFRAAGIPAPVL